MGTLPIEELRNGLARFEADWVGGEGSGLISRIDPDGTDYYTLLEKSDAPAALVEGAYISNASEEALAKTDAFHQEYAVGVYRALVRFVTTEDNPIPPPEPQVWDPDGGTVSLNDCVVPGP